MATTHGGAAATWPCWRVELALDRALQRSDQPLGEQRVGAARLVAVMRAGQHADADQERLLAADDAGAVEHVLHSRLGGVDLGGDEARRAPRRREGCRRMPRIEHGIEQRGGGATGCAPAAAPCP